MGIWIAVPPAATPVAVVDALLRMYERDEIERTIEALIDRLDRLDGDPDLEPNGDDADADGDEQDHGGAEDDFCPHQQDGPGCPIGDSDAASWAERPEGGLTLQTHGQEDDEPDAPEMRRAHTRYIRADLRRRGRA